MLGVQAGKAMGVDPGRQIDVSAFQKVVRAPDVSGRDRALLRAFATHAVWSQERLHTVGYDVPYTCAICGAAGDNLGHRLFKCPGTAALRAQHLEADDLEWLTYHAEMGVVGLGVQIMPAGGHRPAGLGHEAPETWTLTGRPLAEVLQGEVFIDGSCFKRGPPPWHTAGWSVIKMSQDGVLLGWVRGRVGQQLPATSPASEHVAALAATAFVGATPAATAFSDYQGLHALEEKPMHTITYRKSIYSGIRVQIKARAPPGFKICKVQAHVDPQACTDPRARYLALGNEAADRIAKGAAMESTGGPTSAELESWEREAAFLQRYLRYIPAALALWPQVGPTSCKKSLPRRRDVAPSRKNRGASFRSDVLGVLRLARATAATAEEDGSLLPGGAQGSDRPLDEAAAGAQGDFPAASSSGPAEHPQVQGASPPSDEPQRHHWRWQYGRWICGNCLARSRLPVPPRSACPGLARNLASLLRNPRGHILQIAPFTDGKGLVVICSKCGHHSTSNRPCQLHKKACLGVFESEGAKHSYERVGRGQHPKYSKGTARVLEPCMSPAMLEALAQI